MEPPYKHLAVGYPWASPFLYTDFVDAMLALERPEGVKVSFLRGEGWCSARRHIHICEQAVARGADLICIVGADQVHPINMLPRLIACMNEDCEAVAALVPYRGAHPVDGTKPFQRLAWKQNTDTGGFELIDPDSRAIQQINAIGSGVLMFQTHHLLKLARPWFRETIHTKDMTRTPNMDSTFVWRLQKEAGASVFVDTTIKVKHCNVFQIDETFSDRFADWGKPKKGLDHAT